MIIASREMINKVSSPYGKPAEVGSEDFSEFQVIIDCHYYFYFRLLYLAMDTISLAYAWLP